MTGTYAVARAPLRVPLGGGGTDLPWYAAQFGGSLLTVTLSAGVSVRLNPAPPDNTPEPAGDLSGDGWTRRALALLGRPDTLYRVRSVADVPAGTGLGSSGAYLVALAAAVSILEGDDVAADSVARAACAAETALSDGEAGPQDTWASALGGLRRLDVHTDGSVGVRHEPPAPEVLSWLDQHVTLVYCGVTRSAAGELRRQRERPAADRTAELHRIREIGHAAEAALRSADLAAFAAAVNEHDRIKRLRSPLPPAAEHIVTLGRSTGAAGAKLVGAGGGGVVLLVHPAERAEHLRHALRASNTPPLDTSFSPVGVTAGRGEDDDAV
ncbi:GHMP family kinase ATP-binding protein [Streptomyces sp. NPDC054784]